MFTHAVRNVDKHIFFNSAETLLAYVHCYLQTQSEQTTDNKSKLQSWYNMKVIRIKNKEIKLLETTQNK